MSKVAGMRRGASLFREVAHSLWHAGAAFQHASEDELRGAGFTTAVPVLVRFALAMLLLSATGTATGAGRTPGTFGVSSSGEAQYAIPIFAPPGVNGLVPELSLTYGSHHDGSLAGVGWGVSGLSAIYRCARTWAQNDGMAAAPQNRFDDRYCLDGVQLRHFSGTYGRTGSTYRTELESYARITVLSEAGNGPGSFKVELKNGLIYEYGATADSRILSLGKQEARAWALNQISDRSGNHITVGWYNDTTNGSYRIHRLDYATNAIVFAWESKPADEVASGYVIGRQVREIHRLDAIEVWQGSTSLRRYDLTYEGPLSSTSRSRLTSIEECAGSDCRPPTTFAYQNGSIGLQGELDTGQPVPLAVDTVLPLDINGDGREDVVYVSSTTAGGTWRVMLASTSGGYSVPIDSGQPNSNYGGAIPIDYNQDGLGDVLVPYDNSTWWVMLGSASGLGALTNTWAPASSTGRGDNARALDINGDGREDLVWADLVGGFNGGDAIKYRLRNASGGGFGAETALVGPLPPDSMIDWGVFYDWAQKQRGKAPDFNGDRRGDIVYVQTKRIWNQFLNRWDTFRTLTAQCTGGGCSFAESVPGGASPPSFGDFNRDGLTDLFYYSGPTQIPNNSSWWYALSRGTDFATAVAHGNANGFTTTHVILDWDSDGRDDVLAQYTSGGWALARANGLGFDAWTPIGGSFPSTYAPMAVTDIDGDGLHDFAYLQSNTWRYRKHAGARPDLLTRITDGYGNTVDISHAPLTASGVHTKTAGALFPEQEWQGPVSVVTRHSASNGIGGAYSVDHTYAGARLHLQGRGFEGFSRHTRIDSRNGLRTHHYFVRLFPHTGQPDRIEVRQANDTTLVESTDVVWSAATPVGGIETRTSPYASKSTATRYGVGATFNGTLLATSVTDTTVDAATGTPTEVRVTTTEASGANGIRGGSTWTERVLHSNLTNYTTGTDWCIGRPQRSQQINSNSTGYGNEETRVLVTTWDATYCRPTKQVLEPDNTQWRLELDLAYDSLGNLKTQTIGDGAGPLPNRVWTTTWSADGRFPLKRKNPLNQTMQRAFDGRFGLPSTESDPNGLVTTFAYDGFGRQTSEARPDQMSTHWAYAACGANCGEYVTATQKAKSGSVIRTDYVYFDDFDRLYLTRTELLGGGYSRVERQYDAEGRVSGESAPCVEGACPSQPYWTTYSYDLIARPTQISRPFTPISTQTTTIAYAGLKATITDPLGKLSIRTEDGRGRLARSADDDGYFQTFDYDAFGNPVRVTDSAGRVLQSASFNVRGLRESASDADLGPWQYAYNAFGEPVSQTDANGNITTYTWDSLGRPLTRVMPEGTGSITRSWIWGTSADNTPGGKYVGRLKESQVSGTGVTTYRELHSYDSKARPVQTEYFQGTSSIGVVNLTYVASTGLVDSLTYPESTAQYRLKLKYEYDRGLLKRVKDFNAPTTVFWEATTMDAYGQVIDETLGGVLKTIRGVEPRTGYLTSIMSGPLADPSARKDLEYVWDVAGNLKSRADLNRSLSEAFTYDDLHRLTRVTRNSVNTLTLSYAPNGNILSKSDVGTYTYHPTKLHAVTSITGSTNQTFSYDANGNMTGRNGGQLLWFADSRAKRVRMSPGSAANSSEFQYGPDGQRWYHKINFAGAIYTHVNLGGIFEIVAKGAIDDFRHIIHANGVPVALYSRKSTGSNTLRYLLRDHLGSVDVITTSAGGAEVSTSYYPFGERRNATWDGPIPPADATAVRDISRRGFTDHEHLDSTKFIHMNGRVYDPALARFVSADPFVDGATQTQGWNRYSYVGNNPLSYVDPSGFGSIPSADAPPESSPDGGMFNNCFGSAGVQVCVGGSGIRDNARFNDAYSARYRAPELTPSQMHGLALHRYRATLGTENFMPHLGLAPLEGDVGSIHNAMIAVGEWWDRESAVTFCGHGCNKGWNGDRSDQFAPQVNVARNGDRIVDTALGMAGMYPLGVPARIGVGARTAAAARNAAGTSEAFHYTFSRALASIRSHGLRSGSYATTNGTLSPLQAQIDLALPANRSLPNVLVRIDLARLRQAGYRIPEVTQVQRSYGMPGGGFEMQFPYPIPAEFIKVVRP
jgi:RHS repeat-associated protein